MVWFYVTTGWIITIVSITAFYVWSLKTPRTKPHEQNAQNDSTKSKT